MSDFQSEYKSIFKATSLFGGVQIFSILISIIRSKIIAVLLGPEGMGIINLFSSAIGLVTSFTNFGLSTSAVRNISQANESKDLIRIAKTAKVLKKCVWYTGLLGLIIMIICSKQLSVYTFGSTNYQISFIWLSLTLLFAQLTVGHLVLLQGLRKLKHLALVNLLGNLLGLIVSIPLYFYFKIDAIVPSLILSSLVLFAFSCFFSNVIKFPSVRITKVESKQIGFDMIKTGFIISISNLLTIIAAYIVRILISNDGGLEVVGLFSAGFAILNTYVGLIFTAMGSDYLPRLSAVSEDNKACESLINKQAEISLLILFPLLMCFSIAGKFFLSILYTSEFSAALGMILWGSIGMIFKALNWCYSLVFIPKRKNAVYFNLSFLSSVFYLVLNCLLYNLLGLTGLGIAFILANLFDFILAYICGLKLFNIKFHTNIKLLVVIALLVLFFCVCVALLLNYTYVLMINITVSVLVLYWSIKRLDTLIGLFRIVKNRFIKNE